MSDEEFLQKKVAILDLLRKVADCPMWYVEGWRRAAREILGLDFSEDALDQIVGTTRRPSKGE